VLNIHIVCKHSNNLLTRTSSLLFESIQRSKVIQYVSDDKLLFKHTHVLQYLCRTNNVANTTIEYTCKYRSLLPY